MTACRHFSRGLPDRADQFAVHATLGNDGVPVDDVRTATRGSDGSIVYGTTTVAADRGTFNPQNGAIKIRISFTTLNSLLAAGRPPIGPGSTLVGLRGRTSGPGSTMVRSDETYAGTQFTIPTGP